MSKNNNLNELNSILFETLRGVQDGTIDAQRANAVQSLGNTIINGAKTLLQAHKQSKATMAPAFFALPEPSAHHLLDNGKSPAEAFVAMKGYISIAQCRAVLGERAYTDELAAFKKNHNIANRM